jgi:hypothetical protein
VHSEPFELIAYYQLSWQTPTNSFGSNFYFMGTVEMKSKRLSAS